MRPLPDPFLEYVAGDTIYMPYIYDICMKKLRMDPEEMEMVIKESQALVKGTQSPDYRTSGRYAPPEFLNLYIRRHNGV